VSRSEHRAWDELCKWKSRNGKAEKSLGINATYIQQQTEDKFITQGGSKN